MSIPRMDTADPDYRRAMYVRYADDFVFLLEGPKEVAGKIKGRIKTFLMEELGLELNDQKTVITHIGEGFQFLGANVKSRPHTGFRARGSKHGPSITMRAGARARVNAATKTLIEKLIIAGFAKRNSNKLITAKPMTRMVNHDHSTIIQFYNNKITGILNYYSFAGNRSELHNVVWILTHSLAKTLARKHKLRSARQAFIKFGPNLTDPDTDLKLNIPKSLPATHHYQVNKHVPGAEEILDKSWHTSLTNNRLFKSCLLCGSTSNVQMHHVRRVRDIRVKMANSKVPFNVWKGAFLRKQIPLCQYHHVLYHHGKLLAYEIRKIANYSANLSSQIAQGAEEDKN